MILVFDASALIAYLKGEQGDETTRSLLLDRATDRVVHAVNLCEMFYHFLRTGDRHRADSALLDLQQTGLVTRDDLDPTFWRSVARIKADLQRVSLGDCFGVALAQRAGGAVVTADHAEFDLVAATGACPVSFIR